MSVFGNSRDIALLLFEIEKSAHMCQMFPFSRCDKQHMYVAFAKPNKGNLHRNQISRVVKNDVPAFIYSPEKPYKTLRV